MPLFSSLGKYLDTCLHSRFKIDFSNYKNHFDLLKDRNFDNKMLYEPLYDLKNICSCCGMRLQYYKDYIDHLDLHFNINLMERNSKHQRKVINRKAMHDSNWCTENLSTLNSSK